MQYEVIGFQQITYKDKRTGAPVVAHRIFLTRSPSEFDRDVTGLISDSIFCPSSLYSPRLGESIRLNYQPGYDGQARLVGVDVYA